MPEDLGVESMMSLLAWHRLLWLTGNGGAKTHPSGAPWGRKYVNVRRLFVYIEHFIDEGAN